MSTSFLYMFIRPNAGTTREQLESKLSNAKDWFRFEDGHYIVYTMRPIATWQSILLPLVKPDGSLLISKLDMTEGPNGWMTESFWTWIHKDRASPP